jgi:hypothetical protein
MQVRGVTLSGTEYVYWRRIRQTGSRTHQAGKFGWDASSHPVSFGQKYAINMAFSKLLQ